MLIKFSIENYLSFEKNTEFSMVASRERQHGERVPQINKYRMRLLPIAAIYGGNASGKTNFFKALHFVQELVAIGTQPDSLIPVDFFLLNPKANEESASFTVELLIKEIIYELSFTLSKEAILEEKLIELGSANEKILYHRKNGKVDLHKSLESDKLLQFAFQGTRKNQLFLTNSVSQNVNHFKDVYKWFKNRLVLIGPDSIFKSFKYFLDEDHDLRLAMNEILPQLDTGIVSIKGEKISFENSFPEPLKKKIKEDLKEGSTMHLATSTGRFIVEREKNQLAARKLVTYHANSEGKSIKFEIDQESDGTQRLMDLLPAFIDATNSERVYFIDEVDRNLHTLLSRKLLEMHLNKCNHQSRSQLIFTTHDILLMDQDLLRRDEMWITERNKKNASSMMSFIDYKDVRYDKDIRKSYLQGRLGGIPRLCLNTTAKSGTARKK